MRVDTHSGEYVAESCRPIVILVFLLPMVLLHELGARYYGTEVGASSILRSVVGLLGFYGRSVPALLLVLTLLIWHLVLRDRWSFKGKTLPLMAGESLLFALPIFGISVICQQFLPLATPLQQQPLGALWALSLGAGVYEELVFRLYLCGILVIIARFVFGLSPIKSIILAVICSSVLFSLYHYLGYERFDLFSFVFRALAGAYFATLLSLRGFGITAGAHAAYDVIVVTLWQF